MRCMVPFWICLLMPCQKNFPSVRFQSSYPKCGGKEELFILKYIIGIIFWHAILFGKCMTLRYLLFVTIFFAFQLLLTIHGLKRKGHRITRKSIYNLTPLLDCMFKSYVVYPQLSITKIAFKVPKVLGEKQKYILKVLSLIQNQMLIHFNVSKSCKKSLFRPGSWVDDSTKGLYLPMAMHGCFY